MKIVINTCYGGFGLSAEAESEVATLSQYWGSEAFRSHPTLIAVVEKLGPSANGAHANLKIVDVPDDVEWTIEEYDGSEWVAEKHRVWR